MPFAIARLRAWTIDRQLLIGGVAIAVFSAGAGFLVARVTDQHASEAEAHAGEHAGGEEKYSDEHEEGFVALKPADAPAAGVELAHVERGGGIDLLLPGRVAPAANAQAKVDAPLDGTIIEMHVAAGTIVAKGGPIASIRSPDGATAHAQLDAAKAFPRPIATVIASEPAAFYPAEAYHQDYATRHPLDPYIAMNDTPKVKNLEKLFPALYRAKPALVADATR